MIAAHLDHGLDPDSRARARRACALASELAVPFQAERAEVERERGRGESLEAAARRVRYAFLERIRDSAGGAGILTAHHLNDQLETLILRLLLGSGLRGLAGIRARHGLVRRPLLALTRSQLATAVDDAGLRPVRDVTNHDLGPLRNRVRRRLSRFGEGEERLARSAGRLASRMEILRESLDRRLADEVDLRLESVATTGGDSTTAEASVVIERLRGLEGGLRRWALALLHEAAGAPYPPRAAAVRELERQLEAAGRLRCDAGGGWSWRARAGRLSVGHDR